MKKVGICACYNTLNYGSMLQSFATQYVIEKMGYDCEFIRYEKKKNLLFYIKAIPRLVNHTLLSDKLQKAQQKINFELHPTIKKKNGLRIRAFKRYQDKYYKAFSEVYKGYDKLCRGSKKYDTVIVGSDQLWLPGGLATNFYNLMFVDDDTNKVSYATSFGVKEIPWYQSKRTQQYLNRINYLSVRENQGATIIKSLTGREAKVVVDPTMLLTKEEWGDIIPNRKVINEPYIFCYFLGENPEHRKVAEELKQKTKLKIVTTPFLDSFVKSDMEFGDFQLFDIGPDDFVNLIRNATYVLTDSFHGSVFSIMQHKQFVIFNRFGTGNKNSRNSRIDSLCELLGLSKRRYDNDILATVKEKIDYEQVDYRLQKLQDDSKLYLEEALKC